MNIVLSNISPMAIAPIDLYPTFPSSDLSLIILVNLAFTKLPTIYEIKDAINILGVCENIYAKLSCPSQKPAAGSINAIVETTTKSKLQTTPKRIVFCAVDSPYVSAITDVRINTSG